MMMMMMCVSLPKKQKAGDTALHKAVYARSRALLCVGAAFGRNAQSPRLSLRKKRRKRKEREREGEGNDAAQAHAALRKCGADAKISAALDRKSEGVVKRARAVCDVGADVDLRNKYGDGPLHAAAHVDCAEIAAVLLEYGAVIDAPNAHSHTPLLVAARESHARTCALLARRVGAHALDCVSAPEGYAAMHWACINDCPKVVQVLLKNGASHAVRSEPDKHTPLIKAVLCSSPRCVELLIRAQCALDATEGEGLSALHFAAKSNQLLCVQLLVAAGANVRHQDHHGHPAVYYAAIARSKKCLQAIAKRIPNFDQTPLAHQCNALILRAKDDDEVKGAACFATFGGCFS